MKAIIPLNIFALNIYGNEFEKPITWRKLYFNLIMKYALLPEALGDEEQGNNTTTINH